ncbi:glutathione S-transferase family protein [Phenylobacterium immobile]|uniref:glutathione S-transferase family protein n=1 Tax=Phenylobacterium immobile TaxID=21 RepID=UPI000A4F0B3A|nr:glutathione S-transferase family protein [Phenylobacterium immobile]
MTHLTLISTQTCPYVQRAAIALREKGVAFEIQYVDLQNKPDWFLAISPLGKVPVLRIDRPGEPEAILFESMVILEYLEETADGPKLHPADPLAKARRRAWMEFGNAVMGDMRQVVQAGDDAALAKASATLGAKLKRVEDEMVGPLFAGEAFCAVDAVFAPMFRELDLAERLNGRKLVDCSAKIMAWREALAERPSVRQAVPTDFGDRYLARMKERGFRMVAAA